jgi:phosphoserine phosphatase
MEYETDVALQTESVMRMSNRLVAINMNSALIEQEVIDETASYAGVYKQVESISHRAMNDELDFNQSLEQRVALLRGTL